MTNVTAHGMRRDRDHRVGRRASAMMESDERRRVMTANTTVTPAIEVAGLIKRYGDVLALDSFDLTVQQGEIFGLLGPNGSGKSTAINCILALLSYDAGRIRVFGEPIHSTSYALKRRIGIVPQNVAVFNELTVVENVDYCCSLYEPNKARRREPTLWDWGSSASFGRANCREVCCGGSISHAASRTGPISSSSTSRPSPLTPRAAMRFSKAFSG